MPDIKALFKSEFTVRWVTGMYVHTWKMESVGEHFATALKIILIKLKTAIMAKTRLRASALQCLLK